MTKEQINTASKIWYKKYGMGYNTPVMSEGELEEHLYRKGFEKGAEIRQPEIDKACEFIRAFIIIEDGSSQYYDLLNKAEQFLKEQGHE